MITNGTLFAEIKALKGAVEAYIGVINTQTALIQQLRQDNRDMLNRLMSGNMLTYAQTSPASVAEMNIPAERLAREDEFGREHFAGEIVDNAT